MSARGVIYVGTNKEKYIQEAARSATSVKDTSPGIQTAIFTNLPGVVRQSAASAFDDVIDIKPLISRYPKLLFIDKIQSLIDSPYDETLYLDSDTHVFCDLNDVFSLLQRFQIVLTFGHNRNLRDCVARGVVADQDGLTSKRLDDNIPVSLSPVQGGFALVKSSDQAVRKWLSSVKDLYIKNNHRDDQIVMRQMIWEDKNIAFYMLPEEYNFRSYNSFARWKNACFTEAVPKIMHFTDHKKNPEPYIRRIKPYVDSRPRRRSFLFKVLKIIKTKLGI